MWFRNCCQNHVGLFSYVSILILIHVWLGQSEGVLVVVVVVVVVKTTVALDLPNYWNGFSTRFFRDFMLQRRQISFEPWPSFVAFWFPLLQIKQCSTLVDNALSANSPVFATVFVQCAHTCGTRPWTYMSYSATRCVFVRCCFCLMWVGSILCAWSLDYIGAFIPFRNLLACLIFCVPQTANCETCGDL